MSHHLMKPNKVPRYHLEVFFSLNFDVLSFLSQRSTFFLVFFLLQLWKRRNGMMGELDIDVSDIGSYVRRCNSITNFILELVGNIHVILVNYSSSQPLQTHDFLNYIYEESDNCDFSINEQQWAKKFIKFHGIFLQPSSCYVYTLNKSCCKK